MLLGVLEVFVKGSSFRCCDPYSNTRLPSTAPASSAGLFHWCFLPSTTTKCTLSSFVWLLPLAEKNTLVFLVWLYPGGTVAWTLDTGSSCTVILAVCCAVLPRETLSLQGERDRNRRNPHNQGH